MELSVDGKKYNVLVTGLKRSFQVLDGENAERALSGRMIRDIIGTFYNYEMTLQPKIGKYADYDALYEVLSAPVASHKVVLPYGQRTLTFNAYVTAGQDNLIRKKSTESYWTGLTVQFIAMAPQRT